MTTKAQIDLSIESHYVTHIKMVSISRQRSFQIHLWNENMTLVSVIFFLRFHLK